MTLLCTRSVSNSILGWYESSCLRTLYGCITESWTTILTLHYVFITKAYGNFRSGCWRWLFSRWYCQKHMWLDFGKPTILSLSAFWEILILSIEATMVLSCYGTVQLKLGTRFWLLASVHRYYSSPWSMIMCYLRVTVVVSQISLMWVVENNYFMNFHANLFTSFAEEMQA